MMKRAMMLICIILALWVPLSVCAEAWDDVIGTPAPQIDLVCADGTEFSLYETLREKELAVVCLFGSGCGACQREMRALDKAYRLYQDRVAVIGLSLDRTRDTPEALNAFQEAQGLSFPLGRDPARTARFLKINMYPAFMLVSNAGEVVYVEVNGPASIDHFVELFDWYLDGVPMSSLISEADADFCDEDSCLIPEE